MALLISSPAPTFEYYAPTPSYGTVTYVHNTGDVDDNGAALQAAIDAAAVAGDGRTIVLDQGVEYRGAFWTGAQFQLKAHDGPPITICTDGFQDDDPLFPSYGEMITPADGPNLAVLTSLDTLPGLVNRTTLLIPYDVHYWHIRGIRIRPSTSHQYPIVKLGGYVSSDLDNHGTDPTKQTSHIVFDRVLIDPQSTWTGSEITGHHFLNFTAALQLNSRLCHVTGCHVEVYDVTGQGDYKCLESGYGRENLIEDSKFWGGGETIFIGGGGSPVPFEQYTPVRDWLFRRCIIGKDHTQMKLDGFLSKNVLETKGSVRIQFVGCVIDGNQTVTGDTGQQRQFTGVPYPGGEDRIFFTTRDWTFTDCIFRRGYAFTLQRKYFNESSYYGQVPSQNLTLDNCLLYRFRTSPAFFIYLYGWSGLNFNHCTFDLYDHTSAAEPFSGMVMYEDQEVNGSPATPFTGFSWTNNIFAGNYLRLLSNNGEIGSYKYNNAFYTQYLNGNSPTLANNLWLAVGAHNGDPANLFDTHFTTIDAGPNWDGRNDADYRTTIFENADTGDYRLKTGLAYKASGARDATDGKDLGVDFAQMEASMGPAVWAFANLGF